MLTLLDEVNRDILLKHINKAWEKKEIPRARTNAFVVDVFKKGDSSQTSHYRPTRLLRTWYKLLMRLMQVRLAKNTDHLISERQWGFRKARSTSSPIHVVRRVRFLL